MSKRMLIDASHPEETRVVVLDGSKVEEFDFEAASKRPLKGNIYLAKVTRVEPSLQAAFVEYGGNRQGFLAFSEIHPDYYQIPVADRQALIAEQEAEARRRQEDDIESFEIGSGPKPQKDEDEKDESEDEAPDSAQDAVPPATALPETSEAANARHREDEHEEVFVNYAGQDVEEDSAPEHDTPASESESHEFAGEAEATVPSESEGEPAGDARESENSESLAPEHGGAQALQSSRPPQRWMRRKHYKIQEVIKRRQIILVQVVKEERGNKGAALTTYLSLAGRYCVLMPNTPRGGGISRKITDAGDRKRLKSAAQALELPEGMGLIIRTAGENRTKVEIKRDYEYLLRLWDTIREKTLSSNAPACVYEEGDLIKRAIRDLYNKDVGEVIVEGDEGYHNAKDFMRMLMPSHAKNVQPYKEPVPLFQRMHIEAQLDAIFSTNVTLKSGGYIVINQTEALVSIDVNSGRATREHSIEETARKTNLEAADEVGRQLRLRDLAGLIVIDFIDMEDGRNDREVEKRLRDAVKNDRARVQIGKISQFGLLEMSRQRLRAGVVAGSTVPCPHCGGQGIVRSVESMALRVLRALEDEGEKNRADAVTVRVAGGVVIYTLNQKRRELARIEQEYGLEISFEPKENLPAGEFDLERTKQRDPNQRPRHAVSIEAGFTAAQQDAREDEPEIVEDEQDEEAEETSGAEVGSEENLHETSQSGEQSQRTNEGGGKRRRRRRGGRGRNRDRQDHRPNDPHHVHQGDAQHSPQGDAPRYEPETSEASTRAVAYAENPPLPDQPDAQGQPGGPSQPGEGAPRRRRRRRGRRGGRDRHQNGQPHEPQNAAPEFAAPGTERFGIPDEIDTTPREETPARVPNDESAKPAKKGWWQRTFSNE